MKALEKNREKHFVIYFHTYIHLPDILIYTYINIHIYNHLNNICTIFYFIIHFHFMMIYICQCKRNNQYENILHTVCLVCDTAQKIIKIISKDKIN